MLKPITIFSRGTRDVSVSVSVSENGPWQEINTGTLDDPRVVDGIPQDTETFQVQAVVTRYVKFLCISYYGLGCGLQYIGVSGGTAAFISY